ncbi:MAG: hypothetical protein Udaeo2_22800 [Candidatus Udaeobacter sp.]|nr:MAG: hypothetical protein Udaeo2_22800 [Candidatus Udaeobacter sp.]
MVCAAVASKPREGDIKDAIYDREPTALILHPRGKPVNSRIQVHRPIGLGDTGVHVQRINEMLLGVAVYHRIEEKRPGSKIDNRSASDTERTNVAARQS